MMGFSIAAPVGPIGVLCIRRTLSEGRRAGLLTGLGAATADAVYGCVAGFGLVFISRVLVSHRIWLRFFGGLFLCYLGIKTFLAKPAQQVPSIERSGLISAYVSTFFLTLTNPMTIVSFVGIFAGLGLASGGDWVSATALVFGVFLGSVVAHFERRCRTVSDKVQPSLDAVGE
jgi:threonine/homoserine/homoserine lactone efflux protein